MGMQEKIIEALNLIKAKAKSTSIKIQNKVSRQQNQDPENGSSIGEVPKKESFVSQKLKDFTHKENFKKYFSPEAKAALKNKIKSAQVRLKDKADEISKKMPSKKKDK